MHQVKDIDWEVVWQEPLKTNNIKERNWDKRAKKFHRKTKPGDYIDLLFQKLILDKEDTVLDLGCGEGSISIPIANRVKSVTCLDSSRGMLEVLSDKARENKVTNIKTILSSIEDISYDDLGHYDVVVASRSMNNIIPIRKTIETINEIANKYVFISLIGPESWKPEREFKESVGIDSNYSSYITLLNLLYSMGIYANVERLNIKTHNVYEDLADAMGMYREDLLNNTEKEKLVEYLNKTLTVDKETGKLFNKKDKSDWILIWWKKDF